MEKVVAGQIFGRWTVRYELPRTKGERYQAQCECSCGTSRPVAVIELQRGRSLSCGCTRVGVQPIHGQCGNPEYSAYRAAKNRCTNPNDPGHANYGERGIEFRFESFMQFFEVLGPKPTPKHSLDRKDNDGHYEPGNVQWATRTEQNRNTRSNHFVLKDGELLTITECAERLGLNQSAMSYRIKKQWCPECVIKPRNRTGCPHSAV